MDLKLLLLILIFFNLHFDYLKHAIYFSFNIIFSTQHALYLIILNFFFSLFFFHMIFIYFKVINCYCFFIIC